MSDEYSGYKKPEAKWEPGTLDATRRNIGPIDKEEAAKMTKILGGQIFTEKSAPIDYSAFPPKERHYAHRPSGKTTADISHAGAAVSKQSEDSSEKSGGKKSFTTADGLPAIPPKEKQAMEKLMMSEDYKIKPNYGVFNFIRIFMGNKNEMLRRGFIEFTLKTHIDHLQNFITTVKSLIQLCPDSYKAKIVGDSEDRFRFLRTVGAWNMRDVKVLALQLEENPDSITVAMTSPLVKAIYKDLLKVYYLGENSIPRYFKEIYSDLGKFPKFDQQKVKILSKQGITEWLYVYGQIIKGMYPLLMRLCSPKFEVFPDFFTTQTGSILKFLGITKFDLILPMKKEEKQKKHEEEVKKEKEAEAKKREENIRGKKTPIVDAGIKLLCQLFPDSGFDKLDSHPDMFPYFQPLYQFRDGYNMLAPDNPMQVTITLLRIIEDIFHGLRNVIFTIEDDGDTGSSKDSLTTALNEWSAYREVLFERHYCDQLIDFMNQQYSQSDFKTTLFGKRLLTTMLWQTKFNFLPNFEFTQLLLEKPQNDSQYKPLCLRTDFLRRIFTDMSRSIDQAAKTHGTVMGIANPWKKYEFDLPNVVSKRMDVLLGAKKSEEDTSATNANLVKYALLTVSVLDWWVNNPSSPAYTSDPAKVYRVNSTDGGPAFSAPLREDQNKLFAESVKRAAAAK